MREDEPLDGADRTAAAADELAAALGGLRPAAPRTSARQVWYQAGFEAGRQRARGWQVATAATVLLAAGLMVRVAWGPGPATPALVERVVYVPSGPAIPPPARVSPPADATPPEPSAVAVLRLREAVLEGGWTALPPSAGGGADGPSLRARPAGSIDDLDLFRPSRPFNPRG